MFNRLQHHTFSTQLLGMLCIAITFCIGTLATHPHAYYLASSADGLALIDLVNDLLNGVSILAWNLPRAPSFFPDQLIAVGALLISDELPIILLIISTIHYCLLCLVFWLILNAKPKQDTVSLIRVSLIISALIITILTLLPDSLGTIFYQIFTSGTHLGSALCSLLLIHLLQAQDIQKSSWQSSSLIFMIAILGSASNTMLTLLLVIWLGKEVLRLGIVKAITQSKNQVLIIGLAIGALLNFALPKQPLKESFLNLALWTARANDFTEHLLSAPSAFVLYSLLIGAVIVWPLWEDQQSFILKNYRHNFKTLLANDFALPSLGMIMITPLMYQEWNSLRYLLFPTLLLLLCLCKKWLSLSYQAHATDYHHNFFQWFIYGGIASLAALFFFSKPAPNPNQMLIEDGLRCMKQAAKEVHLEDGIASYWQARPIRFASHFAYFLAQVKPDYPQMGFFFWGNNGRQFVYADKDQKTLRNYNYILASHEEVAQNKWGSILLKAERTFDCNLSTVYYFAKSPVLWNFLFTKNQPIPPDLLAGLWLKQAQFLEQTAQTFLASDLSTQSGRLDGNRIYSQKAGGYLVYGPYIHLNAGNYRLILSGSVPQGIIEITAQNGQIVLSRQPIAELANASSNPSPSKSLDFSVKSAQTQVEFRILVPNDANAYFQSFTLEHLSNLASQQATKSD